MCNSKIDAFPRSPLCTSSWPWLLKSAQASSVSLAAKKYAIEVLEESQARNSTRLKKRHSAVWRRWKSTRKKQVWDKYLEERRTLGKTPVKQKLPERKAEEPKSAPHFAEQTKEKTPVKSICSQQWFKTYISLNQSTRRYSKNHAWKRAVEEVEDGREKVANDLRYFEVRIELVVGLFLACEFRSSRSSRAILQFKGVWLAYRIGPHADLRLKLLKRGVERISRISAAGLLGASRQGRVDFGSRLDVVDTRSRRPWDV